jgi:phage-related protein
MGAAQLSRVFQPLCDGKESLNSSASGSQLESAQEHIRLSFARQGYTNTCIFGFVNAEAEHPRQDTEIAWEGDSKEVISGFPDEVKQNLGFQLRQLQQGEKPSNYRPLPQIGHGVYELRDEDERAWYRVVYLSQIGNTIHVLHCFEKKSREIPRNEVETAVRRLKLVKARILEHKRHEKRK